MSICCNCCWAPSTDEAENTSYPFFRKIVARRKRFSSRSSSSSTRIGFAGSLLCATMTGLSLLSVTMLAHRAWRLRLWQLQVAELFHDLRQPVECGYAAQPLFVING